MDITNPHVIAGFICLVIGLIGVGFARQPLRDGILDTRTIVSLVIGIVAVIVSIGLFISSGTIF